MPPSNLAVTVKTSELYFLHRGRRVHVWVGHYESNDSAEEAAAILRRRFHRRVRLLRAAMPIVSFRPPHPIQVHVIQIPCGDS